MRFQQNDKIKTLSLSKISKYVSSFIEFAKQHPEMHFLVTEIGCGLAGYKPNEIAPMFEEASNLNNVYLPDSFWKSFKNHSS